MKWIRWIDTAIAVAIVGLVVIARSPNLVYATNCGNVACGGGFNGSIHDFINGPLASYGGPLKVNLNGTQTEIGECTACHTPHMAIMTALVWNHHLSNNTQFTWEANATTVAGTPYATIANNWTGPSSKCLSCHDGSVSESTINWYQGQTPIPGTAACTPDAHGVYDVGCPSYIIVGIGGNMGANAPSKGATHPVAMPYPCGQTGSTYNGVTTGQAIVGTEWVSSPGTGVNNIQLYQEVNGAVSRSPSSGCLSGSAGIECTSCHDVHNSSKAVDYDLIRGTLAGSGSGYLCNECHSK